jgi:tRNA threonylcarbamoyladenosine modification (KEOPS) complex  Pcc1 subunit
MHLLRLKDCFQVKKHQYQGQGKIVAGSKMKLSAEIIITEDFHNIQKLFEAEEKTFANQRAGYELKKNKDSLIFKISAEDSTALKAVLNSITKLLTVYEKTKAAVKV